jgi:TRAP-type C4-dicarboxylate transport system permease small subunit
MVLLEQVSDLAHVPMWIPHGAVVLGFALMVLIMLWRAIAFVLSFFAPPASAAPARKDAVS